MATEFDKSKLTELGILGGLGLYNANQARQDANTQIGNINASQAQFGPDSPYAQQLRQKLERQDAAGGRRSQYGSREVELQARLAEVNANQQSRNAPALSQLYQQRQGSTNSVGRDIASILARSGAMKGLSPMVAGLFKRRLPFDQGDERDIGLNDGYSTSMGQTDFSAGNQGYDSYDYQGDQGPYYDNYDLQSVDTGGFDLYNGVDAGSYDSYDFQDVGDVGGGFDLYSGVDAGTYDAYDFQSLPGFAKGGPVNIFDAIRQSNQKDTRGFKEVNQSVPEAIAAPRKSVFNFDPREGPNDIQKLAGATKLANTASRFAVKGGVLGGFAGVPGMFMADTAKERVGATGVAALTYMNPLLGLAAGLAPLVSKVFGGGESKTPWSKQLDNYFDNGKIKEGGGRGTTYDQIVKGRLKNEANMSDSQISDYLAFRESNPDFNQYKEQAPAPVSAEAPMDPTSIGSGAYSDSAPALAGEVTNAYGNNPAFAAGGHVQGPGTGTSDSILAKLSDGEYVNTAKTVDSLGISLFDKLEEKAKRSSPEELKKFKAGLQALF